MMSEMEKATATVTPPRKSSSALRSKELFNLQPPPSLILDGTPTPHPTPKVSPSLPDATDTLPQSRHHHHQQQEQLPAPPAILSPSSSARRSRRGQLARPRHRAERLSSSSSSSLLPLPSRLCIDDPLMDSPTLRPKKWKNGCSPGGRASPVAQRSSRRVSRRAAMAPMVIEKEEKEFGDVSAQEDHPPTKKGTPRRLGEKEGYKKELDGRDINRVGQWLYELIMWKDVARSSLWFGLGSVCFLASAFAQGISFSFVSVTSQLALLFLAVVFLYNSFARKEKDGDYDASESRNKLVVRQEDIAYAVQMLVSVLNMIISKIRELFSGDPSMTLKVAPILFIASEYGHVLSLWRLFAAGFFLSFTIPKMYSCYAEQLHGQVGHFRSWMLEAWTGCGHKRILATSATTIFWNVSSTRTRFFAAFMFVVLLRFYRQCSQSQGEAGNGDAVVVEVVEEETLDKNE
ncbi:reticulon-like protein B17 [Nymphaea colorata]|nr:reticulon-like protein B17 [Nymphaea colorata]